MKKLYFFLLLFLFHAIAYAQSTVTIFAKYPVGSYKTGTSNVSPSRTDDTMRATAGVNRGFAVFDLSSIPTSATITSVGLHFYIKRAQGFGFPNGTLVRSYNGDISLIASDATLYSTITAAPNIYTATWPTTNNTKVALPSVAAAVTLIQSNLAGGKVSLLWGTGNTWSYTIIGESGPNLDTSVYYAPFISVTYTCAGMTTATATPSPTSICIGSAVALSASASGATGYSWAGPGGFTSTSQVTSTIPPAAGVNTYTVTARNAAGCGLKAIANVTVNALPTVTITASGTTAFCPGGNVTLNATPAGLTYQWYQDGAPISGATNATLTAVTGGLYTVKGTNAQGCTGTSSGVPVFVITTPVLTPSGTVVLCSGGAVPLSVNTGGVTSGLTYQWQNGTTAIIGATNSTYSAITSGDYSVIVSAGATCSGTSTVANITINGLPTPTVSFNGSKVFTSNSFASYQWFLNMVAIPGATSYSVTPPANGNYRVLVTAANGCSNYSSSLAIGNVGVDEVNTVDVKIYPNPASSSVYIESPVKVKAVISSIEGKIIAEQNDAALMDISHLSNGIYFISVYDENSRRITTQKLIKQ